MLCPDTELPFLRAGHSEPRVVARVGRGAALVERAPPRGPDPRGIAAGGEVQVSERVQLRRWNSRAAGRHQDQGDHDEPDSKEHDDLFALRVGRAGGGGCVCGRGCGDDAEPDHHSHRSGNVLESVPGIRARDCTETLEELRGAAPPPATRKRRLRRSRSHHPQ